MTVNSSASDDFLNRGLIGIRRGEKGEEIIRFLFLSYLHIKVDQAIAAGS